MTLVQMENHRAEPAPVVTNKTLRRGPWGPSFMMKRANTYAWRRRDERRRQPATGVSNNVMPVVILTFVFNVPCLGRLTQEIKLLHPVTESINAEIEFLGGLRLVALGDFQGLADQFPFDILDVDTFRRNSQVHRP